MYSLRSLGFRLYLKMDAFYFTALPMSKDGLVMLDLFVRYMLCLRSVRISGLVFLQKHVVCIGQ